ncbi:MAG: hypothetical protein AAFR93_04390 [Pseudomonadota bacterium]
MGEVVRLATAELPVLDHGTMDEMRLSMGDLRFLEVIEEASFQLVEKLCQLERAVALRDLASVARHAQRIRLLSGQIGLEDFAMVSRDVQSCAELGDVTALDAVSARLSRVGETSLFTILRMSDTCPA